MKPLRRRGFTLIELLVVIMVAGVLATFALPIFNSLQNRAKQTTAMYAAAYWTKELHRAAAEQTASGDSNLLDLQPGQSHVPWYFQYVSWVRIGGPTADNPAHQFPLNPVVNGRAMTVISNNNSTPDCVGDLQNPPPSNGYTVGFRFLPYNGTVWPATDSCDEWDPVREAYPADR